MAFGDFGGSVKKNSGGTQFQNKFKYAEGVQDKLKAPTSAALGVYKSSGNKWPKRVIHVSVLVD